MTFLRTVPPEEAADTLKDIYQADLVSMGYVPNYTTAMSLRPDAITAWRNYLATIRSKMRLRRYELVTFAAALALHCTY